MVTTHIKLSTGEEIITQEERITCIGGGGEKGVSALHGAVHSSRTVRVSANGIHRYINPLHIIEYWDESKGW